MRRLLALTLVLLAVQVVFGVVVSMYVTIAAHHPGSSGSGYVNQSERSASWALVNSPPWLQLHTGLGLLLVLLALIILVVAVVTLEGRVFLSGLIGLIGILGSGAAGLAFLDFGQNLSSLLMTVGGALAIAAYAGALLAAPVSRSRY